MRLARFRGLLLAIAYLQEPATATDTGPPVHRVAVYLHEDNLVPAAVLARARSTASEIFAGIGVQLAWPTRTKRTAAADVHIDIQFDRQPPGGLRTEAFGYALPYQPSGIRVHILIDRVLRGAPREHAGFLLGHVIAHEITHMLEQNDRHSIEGLMKPQWDARECLRMASHSLAFDATDAELVLTSLEKAREQQQVAMAGAGR